MCPEENESMSPELSSVASVLKFSDLMLGVDVLTGQPAWSSEPPLSEEDELTFGAWCTMMSDDFVAHVAQPHSQLEGCTLYTSGAGLCFGTQPDGMPFFVSVDELFQARSLAFGAWLDHLISWVRTHPEDYPFEEDEAAKGVVAEVFGGRDFECTNEDCSCHEIAEVAADVAS